MNFDVKNKQRIMNTRITQFEKLIYVITYRFGFGKYFSFWKRTPTAYITGV